MRAKTPKAEAEHKARAYFGRNASLVLRSSPHYAIAWVADGEVEVDHFDTSPMGFQFHFGVDGFTVTYGNMRAFYTVEAQWRVPFGCRLPQRDFEIRYFRGVDDSSADATRPRGLEDE